MGGELSGIRALVTFPEPILRRRPAKAIRMRIAINANIVLNMFNALREFGQPNSGVGDGLPFLVPTFGLTK
jgi:hypothetical protein